MTSPIARCQQLSRIAAFRWCRVNAAPERWGNVILGRKLLASMSIQARYLVFNALGSI